jgi:hypothetical protein
LNNSGGVGVASGDFVGEDEFEELGVAELVGFGEGESVGEGVEAPAELDRPQECFEFGGDGGGREAYAAPPATPSSDEESLWCKGLWVAKCLESLAKRPGGASRAGAFSVARSIIRPIRATLIASARGLGRRRPRRRRLVNAADPWAP